MTAPAKTDAAPDKGPLSVRMTPEQREALDWFVECFPRRYRGAGSVLDDYSLSEAEESFQLSRAYHARTAAA